MVNDTAPFVDLSAQLARLRPAIYTLIGRVMDNGTNIVASEMVEVESRLADFCDATEVVGTSSGTDAVWLPLLALEVGAGYNVLSSDRDHLAGDLEAGGVPPQVYYPRPRRLPPPNQHAVVPSSALETAERLADEILRLPMFRYPTEAQQRQVSETMIDGRAAGRPQAATGRRSL